MANNTPVIEGGTMATYPEPTWENQLIEARKLPTADLKRHASVSTVNSHFCNDCFCCACVIVLKERKDNKS